MNSFYDLTVENTKGETISLAEFKGKVVLVVNTATGCGFTPQYKDLESMYKKLHDKGFEIIDVPCNQFADQTPGTDEEINEFCTINYHTTFPRMKKSDVNGENAIPLFKFLKEQKGFDGFGITPKGIGMTAVLRAMDKDYKNTPDIKWNFTKFLIDREGTVVARFEPTERMEKVFKAVEELL